MRLDVGGTLDPAPRSDCCNVYQFHLACQVSSEEIDDQRLQRQTFKPFPVATKDYVYNQ